MEAIRTRRELYSLANLIFDARSIALLGPKLAVVMHEVVVLIDTTSLVLEIGGNVGLGTIADDVVLTRDEWR